MVLRFANCELDLRRVVLWRDGREVKVEPQVFDLLAYLVQRRGEVVRKEDLLDRVWGDRFVSESALTTRIKDARQAVGDDGSRQAVIRTVHGKGYELVAQVQEVAELGAEASTTADVQPPAIAERAAVDGLLDPQQATTITGGGGSGERPLPAAVQALIGRDALLATLVPALADHRLVTLVGPGGVGKTALAFELARRVASQYADGVHVVELVSVFDTGATTEAFATAIDVSLRRHSSIEDAIVGVLKPRRCLLLLDNCEHLIEPVATLVSRLQREAPGVSILATSREPLALPGERVWAVEPLSTAGASSTAAMLDLLDVPAVALFVERASAADPTFAVDATSAPIIFEICRRLDGIPLAIELAAARTRATDVAEIARRLDERFGLLRAMRRGSDPRHRTMRDAISWSYDLLAPDERRLFTELSVFAGSFDLEAVEAMCTDGDAFDLITRLTERSMLSVRRQADGGTRYELLETMREYARTRLDDESAGDLFSTHAAHFAAVARAVELDLQGPDEPAAMLRADASFADLRAAQRFALEVGDLDTAFGLIGSMREFAMRALRYEVFGWAEVARRAEGAAGHPLVAVLTAMHAYGAWVRGEFDLALTLASDARELERALEPAPCGLVERVLVNVLHVLGRAADGVIESRRQVDLAEASGNASRVVHACYMHAIVMSSAGGNGESLGFVARAQQVARGTGGLTDLASAAVAEGFATRDDDDAALEAFTTAERLARAAGNRWMSAFARTEMSALLVHRGATVAGCAGLVEMVDLWQRAGEWSQQWHTLSRCVIALHRLGRDELAAEMVGAIEAHAELGGTPMSLTLREVLFDTCEALVDRLGASSAAELRAEGASRPVEIVVQRTRAALLALANS